MTSIKMPMATLGVHGQARQGTKKNTNLIQEENVRPDASEEAQTK